MATPSKLSSTPATKPSTKRLALVVFFLINTTIFSTLGIWQVQRLAWKKDLIERVETRVNSAPQDTPLPAQWPQLTQADTEYTPIKLQGRWLADKEVTVYANTDLGPGYWVMVPLQLQVPDAANAAQSIVWVNRGFIPTEQRQTPRSTGQAQDAIVQVTGLLRWPEKANMFLRANVPAENRWYRRWPDELSQARGLRAATAPFFVDALTNTAAAEAWPRGGMTQIQFNNNHLSYAITWFILALLNVAALVFVLKFDAKSKSTQDVDLE